MNSRELQCCVARRVVSMIRSLVLLYVVAGCVGCGTVNTVLLSDDTTVVNLRKTDTYCEALPRVYSGVAYDFCLLHGEPLILPDVHNEGLPEARKDLPVPSNHKNTGAPLIVFDFILSGVMDTLLLPYSIYRQIDKGNLYLE